MVLSDDLHIFAFGSLEPVILTSSMSDSTSAHCLTEKHQKKSLRRGGHLQIDTVKRFIATTIQNVLKIRISYS